MKAKNFTRSGKYIPKREPNPFVMPVVMLAGVLLFAQMVWVKDNDYLFQAFSVQRFQCNTCNGLGVVRDEADDKTLVLCEICMGVGAHNVRRVDEEDKRCPPCDGMGRISDAPGEGRTCKRCDGRGLIRKERWSGSPESLRINQVVIDQKPTETTLVPKAVPDVEQSE